MSRTPLRPLARILAARRKGENPDVIERENIRLRHEAMRDRDRQRAQGRLLVTSLFFLVAFVTVGGRMGQIAASDPAEPRASASGAAILSQRADIVDRNGRILATNLLTHSLYAQVPDLIDPANAAAELARIFPDLDEAALLRRFTDGRRFLWIRRKISPEQMQAVHDIGDPGLLFGPREMRLYPNGAIAAHILGGAGFRREAVNSAEVVGNAGIEKAYDEWLRDPANGGRPLVLSLDLTVQAAVERVLDGGMRLMGARGAAAVLMEAQSGEIIAMASLPDFDPNDRPAPPTEGAPEDSPIFNRAVQGVYELGSTFKIFTVVQAMQLGLVTPETLVDATAPLKWGPHTIREFENKNYGPRLSVTDVIVKSSNAGTGRLALQIGRERQQAFLDELGFFDPTAVELIEAPNARPLLPDRWGDIHTITASYGHGLSASPLHLAAAYATVLNGGTKVTPTLVRGRNPTPGARVVSPEVSAAARSMLRQVVVRGTASFAEVPGYAVGGKTGTADKPRPRALGGGYFPDKTITTFASVFPANDPKYVLIVTLDEPVQVVAGRPRRTAGWTAVPVSSEIVRRAAPLLGLRPAIEPAPLDRVTLTSN